ncbi:MAG: helix-turn-helix domain-containing protein [Ruminococcus sp.]|nr:helix-turn-helix domain-containing protein [Ruminococcus sp.]
MERFYKIPDNLFAFRLSPSAFALYIHLTERFYFSSNIKIKLQTISEQTDMSINTVRRSIKELEGCGLVNTVMHFNQGYRRTNEYVLTRIKGGFSAITAGMFKYILTKLGKSALLVYCAVKSCANVSGRAFPSYKRLTQLTGLSRTSCINIVKELGNLGLLGKEHYISRSGDYGNNNYYAISLSLRVFVFALLLTCSRFARPLMPKTNAWGSTKIDRHITDPLEYSNIERTVITHRFSTMYKNITATLKNLIERAAFEVRRLFLRI